MSNTKHINPTLADRASRAARHNRNELRAQLTIQERDAWLYDTWRDPANHAPRRTVIMQFNEDEGD